MLFLDRPGADPAPYLLPQTAGLGERALLPGPERLGEGQEHQLRPEPELGLNPLLLGPPGLHQIFQALLVCCRLRRHVSALAVHHNLPRRAHRPYDLLLVLRHDAVPEEHGDARHGLGELVEEGLEGVLAGGDDKHPTPVGHRVAHNVCERVRLPGPRWALDNHRVPAAEQVGDFFLLLVGLARKEPLALVRIARHRRVRSCRVCWGWVRQFSWRLRVDVSEPAREKRGPRWCPCMLKVADEALDVFLAGGKIAGLRVQHPLVDEMKLILIDRLPIFV